MHVRIQGGSDGEINHLTLSLGSCWLLHVHLLIENPRVLKKTHSDDDLQFDTNLKHLTTHAGTFTEEDSEVHLTVQNTCRTGNDTRIKYLFHSCFARFVMCKS